MKTKTKDRILSYIKKNKRVKTSDIVTHVGVGDRAVYKHLNNLLTEKAIVKYGKPPKVYYVPSEVSNIVENVKLKPFEISKQKQIKELTERVTPVVNVDVVLFRKGKYLMGRRSRISNPFNQGFWLFPGGRMKYFETPQETAERVIKTELPGVKANIRRLLTVLADKGADPRAYGVTIFYLCEYESGSPHKNDQLDDFKWLTKEEIIQDKNIYWVDKASLVEVEKAISSLYSNQEELLVEVDNNNKEIGSIVKRVAHSDPTKYHRAAHLVIFTSEGKVVLHQRSFNKAIAPGKWDIFGGHQVLGQTIEQCAAAELAEELGISTNLQLKRVGLYQDYQQSEYYHLFYGVDNGPYGYDRNEVEQIHTFDCKELLKSRYDEEYDFLPHVYTYIEELREVWENLLK